eukprot:gene6711-8031_t
MVSTGGDRYNIDLSRIITSDEAPNPRSATLVGHYGKIICGTRQRPNKVKQLNMERISLDVYLGLDGTWYDPHLILGSKTIFENQIPAMKREVDVLISTQPNAFQSARFNLTVMQYAEDNGLEEFIYPPPHYDCTRFVGQVFPEAWDKWQKGIRVRAVASK